MTLVSGAIMASYNATSRNSTMRALSRSKLGEKEFKSYSWDKYEKGDPSFLFELFPRIASKEGELGTVLGLGTGYLLERWSIPEEVWRKDRRARLLENGPSQTPLH